MDTVEVVIKQPGHADRVVRLAEGATRMGRAEDNEIVLSDGGVSRRHAQVYVSRGEVTVEDLGSGNGTYYNGYRIQSQPVHDGDEIVIDPFVLQFKLRGADKATSAPAARGDDGRSAPARLQVVVGSGMAGSSYPITSRGLSIGRSEDRDVVIADPAASRHHCQIALQGGEYVLRDMGSANGVFVNAVRVRECTLADADLVKIGNTEMRFVRYDGGGGGGGGSKEAAAHTPRQQSQADWASEPVGRGGGGTSTREQYASPPPRRRSSRPLFAVLFGGLIVFVGFVTVLLFVIVGVVLYVRMGNASWQPNPMFAPQPPRWTLNLPSGLPEAPVDALFEHGQAKMRERAHREALQDFFRVLKTDPGYPYVDKFAFAAGEFLVLDTLQQELARRAAERAKREAERDQLLEDFREGNRNVKLKAERSLKRQFGDDPIVMKAVPLDAPASLVATQKLANEGVEAMSVKRFDEASKLFLDVLERSKDPTSRNEALARLRLSQKEVARSSTELWSQAVMTEAAGDKMGAKALFLQLKEEHPSNPSVEFHLARLP